VISRLNDEGLETAPVGVGVNLDPALLVRSEPPVVLIPVERGEGAYVFPSPTLDPEGGIVDIGVEIGCARVVAASADGASSTIREVFQISGLCGK
jgi:hypothetical protein